MVNREGTNAFDNGPVPETYSHPVRSSNKLDPTDASNTITTVPSLFEINIMFKIVPRFPFFFWTNRKAIDTLVDAMPKIGSWSHGC